MTPYSNHNWKLMLNLVESFSTSTPVVSVHATEVLPSSCSYLETKALLY